MCFFYFIQLKNKFRKKKTNMKNTIVIILTIIMTIAILAEYQGTGASDSGKAAVATPDAPKTTEKKIESTTEKEQEYFNVKWEEVSPVL